MREEYLEYAREFTTKRAAEYDHDRKILTGRRLIFEDIRNDLRLEDVGFTEYKMKLLVRDYLNEASRNDALGIWERRLAKRKLASVSFSCHNYSQTKRTSNLSADRGPCLNSVNLTRLRSGTVNVEVSFRSSNLFKQLPADLVFIRDVLLEPFRVMPQFLVLHIASMTVHPRDWLSIVPMLDDPIAELKRVATKDRRFHELLVRHIFQMVCDEGMRTIQNHDTSMDRREDALERIDKRTLRELKAYARRLNR